MKKLIKSFALTALAALTIIVCPQNLVFASSSVAPGSEPVVEPYQPPETPPNTIPEVGADAFFVMDAATGQVIISKNADKKEYPASITKILTIALALDSLDDWKQHLNDQIEVSWNATHTLLPGASHIALTEGEVVSLQDMLYAAQIISANDAANVLAEYTAGTMEKFAWMMNDKAKQLGATGSNFVNPSGLPDLNHYTTAEDMAKITRWALTVPGFKEIFGAETYTMAPTNKQPLERPFNAFNLIVSSKSKFRYNGLVGSKSGFTNDARYTLSSAAERSGTELVCVVLKCDRSQMVYEDTWALLNYCFDNFRRVDFPASNINQTPVPVFAGGNKPIGEILVQGGKDISFLLHNNYTLDDVAFQCEIPDKYVVGQPFSPVAVFSLPQDSEIQNPFLVSNAQLSWSGLEEIMANNTSSPWVKAANDHPMEFWFTIGMISVTILAVILRVAYVRHRRHRRRKARLAAARAQMPVRIADRPPITYTTTVKTSSYYNHKAAHRQQNRTGPPKRVQRRDVNIVMYRSENLQDRPRDVGRVR